MWTYVNLTTRPKLFGENGASLTLSIRGVYLIPGGYNQTAVEVLCDVPSPLELKFEFKTMFIGTIGTVLSKVTELRTRSARTLSLPFDYSQLEIDADHRWFPIVRLQVENHVLKEASGDTHSGLKFFGMSAGISIEFALSNDLSTLLQFEEELRVTQEELTVQLESHSDFY